MVKARILLLLGACLSCFYITSLRVDLGASEVGCVKTIWYLTVIITILEVVSVLNRLGAIIAFGNHEVDIKTLFFWHKSKTLGGLFLLCLTFEYISMGILFYKVVSTTEMCKNEIVAYRMFWHAAQLQSWFFIIAFGIIAVICIFFLCVRVGLIVWSQSFSQVFDLEDPTPVPVYHGTDVDVDGESANPRKAEVKKTEEEDKACSICMENEKTHACIPCGHMCLCALCAEDLAKRGVNGQKITRCPICRLDAKNFSRIFQ